MRLRNRPINAIVALAAVLLCLTIISGAVGVFADMPTLRRSAVVLLAITLCLMLAPLFFTVCYLTFERIRGKRE